MLVELLNSEATMLDADADADDGAGTVADTGVAPGARVGARDVVAMIATLESIILDLWFLRLV